MGRSLYRSYDWVISLHCEGKVGTHYVSLGDSVCACWYYPQLNNISNLSNI